jgi:hypothetical protein
MSRIRTLTSLLTGLMVLALAQGNSPSTSLGANRESATPTLSNPRITYLSFSRPQSGRRYLDRLDVYSRGAVHLSHIRWARDRGQTLNFLACISPRQTGRLIALIRRAARVGGGTQHITAPVFGRARQIATVDDMPPLLTLLNYPRLPSTLVHSALTALERLRVRVATTPPYAQSRQYPCVPKRPGGAGARPPVE